MTATDKRWKESDRPKKVLLKLSGEALAAPGSDDIVDWLEIERIAAEIAEVHKKFGTHFVIVPGAGNIWRGRQGIERGMDRSTADYMGMLATILNVLPFRDALKGAGYDSRAMSAIPIDPVCERYIEQRAKRHIEKDRAVVIGCGTGRPFVTTDTAAVSYGLELEVDLILKGTHGKVDGVYDLDPNTHSDAKRYSSISFDEVGQRQLKVMDGTAFQLCRDNQDADPKIVIFNIKHPGSLAKAIAGEEVGTLITAGGETQLYD